MYRGYGSGGGGYSYGRHWDAEDYPTPHQSDIRRIPDHRRQSRNHISPVVKCLLFSFNFLFWVRQFPPQTSFRHFRHINFPSNYFLLDIMYLFMVL